MKTLMGVLLLLPALAMAAGGAEPETPPAFGLSGNVLGQPAAADQTMAQTRQLIEEQARSGPPDKSELSAPVYVQTQQRLSKSFDEPIPDFSEEQTRGSH